MSLRLSIFGAGDERASRTGFGKSDASSCETCRYCGTRLVRRLEIDEEWSRAICPLCHLCLHLERPEIEREALAIWLPEFGQAAVNALAREIHAELVAHGESLSPICDVPSGPPRLRGARSAYAALAERGGAAMERIGTNSPRDLADALGLMSSGSYDRRAELLAGVRLLSLGRFFVAGKDIYRSLLTDRVVRECADLRRDRGGSAC